MNKLEVESRASALGISTRIVSNIQTQLRLLCSVSEMAGCQLSLRDQETLNVTNKWLTSLGVTNDKWELNKSKYLIAVERLEEIHGSARGKKQEITIAHVKTNEPLTESLKVIAKAEAEGDPCALFFALCLDSKINELQMRAEFQPPSFDWRETYSSVIKVDRRAGSKKEEGIAGKPVSMISSGSIAERSRLLDIPHVAYSPSSYYDEGPLLFPIEKKDVKARKLLASEKNNELTIYEKRLESKCSSALYHACWSMFCEYTVQLCEKIESPITEGTASKALSGFENLKEWLSWIKQESDNNLLAQLYSLMIDDINLKILPRHKFKKSEPCFNWRDLVLDTPPISEEVLLESFPDFGDASVQSSSTDSSLDIVSPSVIGSGYHVERDDSSNEFSEGYEAKRAVTLMCMSAKADHDKSKATKRTRSGSQKVDSEPPKPKKSKRSYSYARKPF